MWTTASARFISPMLIMNSRASVCLRYPHPYRCLASGHSGKRKSSLFGSEFYGRIEKSAGIYDKVRDLLTNTESYIKENSHILRQQHMRLIQKNSKHGKSNTEIDFGYTPTSMGSAAKRTESHRPAYILGDQQTFKLGNLRGDTVLSKILGVGTIVSKIQFNQGMVHRQGTAVLQDYRRMIRCGDIIEWFHEKGSAGLLDRFEVIVIQEHLFVPGHFLVTAVVEKGVHVPPQQYALYWKKYHDWISSLEVRAEKAVA